MILPVFFLHSIRLSECCTMLPIHPDLTITTFNFHYLIFLFIFLRCLSSTVLLLSFLGPLNKYWHIVFYSEDFWGLPSICSHCLWILYSIWWKVRRWQPKGGCASFYLFIFPFFSENNNISRCQLLKMTPFYTFPRLFLSVPGDELGK